MRHIQQFTYGSFLEPYECDGVVSLSKDLRPGGVLSESNSWRDILTRNVKSAWLYGNYETDSLYRRVMDQVEQMNDQFFQFDIDRMETLQYLEYGPLQFYRKHTDNADDRVANRKLTAIIQLSHPNDYWGGGLRIDSHTKINGVQKNYAPKTRGSITLFPSHLPHVAEPVLWGTRRVLVAWFRGEEPLR